MHLECTTIMKNTNRQLHYNKLVLVSQKICEPDTFKRQILYCIRNVWMFVFYGKTFALLRKYRDSPIYGFTCCDVLYSLQPLEFGICIDIDHHLLDVSITKSNQVNISDDCNLFGRASGCPGYMRTHVMTSPVLFLVTYENPILIS